MATYLLDIDGTLVHHGTSNMLDGAMDMLLMLKAEGHEIVLLTRRGDREFSGNPSYSKDATFKMLRETRIPYDHIIFDLTSPRIVVNDEPCDSHHHSKNADWDNTEVDSLVNLLLEE